MEKTNVKFYVNNTSLFQKKIDISQKLSQIHEQYSSKIPNDAIFLSSDGCEIDTCDESDYSVSEIILDGIVYMNSKTYQNEKMKPKIVKKIFQFKGVN